MTRASNKEAGFTLVEMLVALAIFSLLSVGATTAMIGGLNSKERISEKLEAITEFETARAILKADLNNLVLRTMRDPYGTQEQYIFTGGDISILTFTRQGRENPGGLEKRGDLERVSYVFEEDKLIRRSLGNANPAPQTPVRDRVLLSGIENVIVSFEDDTQTFNQVFVPNDQISLPVNLFVLTLEFEDGGSLEQKFELRL